MGTELEERQLICRVELNGVVIEWQTNRQVLVYVVGSDTAESLKGKMNELILDVSPNQHTGKAHPEGGKCMSLV